MLTSVEEVAAFPAAAAQLGKKAESLVQLVRLGYRVPRAWVLGDTALAHHLKHSGAEQMLPGLVGTSSNDAAHLEGLGRVRRLILDTPIDEELSRSIADLVDAEPKRRYAVRSSGNMEDLRDASFAGMYETTLNTQGAAAVLNAVRQCWASLYGELTLAYCHRNRVPLERLRMSVVIQHMVEATASGVLFSVNPVTGVDTECLIEACAGTGDALVGGRVTPEQYVYDWRGRRPFAPPFQAAAQQAQNLAPPPPPCSETVKREKTLIAPVQVEELGRIGLALQKHYGFPIDAEWAIEKGQVHLLQCRPITKLGNAGVLGEWTNAEFRDGGIAASACSPLMWSIYAPVWNHALPGFLHSVRLLAHQRPQEWGVLIYGRPYWNIGAVKAGLEKLPGYSEREFNNALGIKSTSHATSVRTPLTLRSLCNGALAVLMVKRRLGQQQRCADAVIHLHRERLRQLEQAIVAGLDRRGLAHLLHELLDEDYFRGEAAYFCHIYNTTNLISAFRSSVKSSVNEADYLSLLSGLQALQHADLTDDIWILTRRLRSDKSALAYWRRNDTATIISRLQRDDNDPFIHEVARLAETHRYLSSRMLDITAPRYDEDPAIIVSAIKSTLELEDNRDPRLAASRQRRRAQAVTERVGQAIPWFRRSRFQRNIRQVRQFLSWRESFKDISTRYYYLIRRLALRVAEELCQDGVLPDRESVFYLRKQDITGYLRGEIGREQLVVALANNRDYHLSFINFQPPNEVGGRPRNETPLRDQGAAALQGIPCSAGVVTGRAKVVKDVADIGRVASGDILMTRFTDPAWTPVFGIACAVVTEAGGVLSHAAVIAREYGIPAVLAVPGITGIIQDGQVITVDGGTGAINLVRQTAD